MMHGKVIYVVPRLVLDKMAHAMDMARAVLSTQNVHVTLAGKGLPVENHNVSGTAQVYLKHSLEESLVISPPPQTFLACLSVCPSVLLFVHCCSHSYLVIGRALLFY